MNYNRGLPWRAYGNLTFIVTLISSYSGSGGRTNSKKGYYIECKDYVKKLAQLSTKENGIGGIHNRC